MTSASGAVHDSSKSNNKTKQAFRRSNSQKSAASWNGSTSAPFYLAQKRYASMSTARAKELKQTLPDSGESLSLSSKPRANTEPTTSDRTADKTREIDNTRSDEHAAQAPSNVNGSSPSRTPPLALSDNSSFFAEVMVATGLSTSSTGSISEDVSSFTEKATDIRHEITSSRSSASSLASKTSSLKCKDKSSRKSSISSVVSVNEKTMTSAPNTSIDSKSPSLPEDSVDGTAPTTTPRRTSDTSSQGQPSPQHAPASPEKSQSKPRSVRIRPSAALARARPRALVATQVGQNDSKNPPMFKTRMNSASKPEENTSTSTQSNLNSVDSPASVRSARSSKDDRHPADDAKAVSSPELQTDSLNHPAWAAFSDNNALNETSLKSDVPFTESWSAFPTSTPETNSNKTDAWSAFESEANSAVAAQSDFPQENNVFNSDQFSSDNQGFTNLKISNSNSKAFPTDPFSNDADMRLGQTEFESCDPFAEISLNNISEDPFQNVEDVFAFESKEKTNDKENEKDFASCESESVNEKETDECLRNDDDDPFQNFKAVFDKSFKDDSDVEHESTSFPLSEQVDSFPTNFKVTVEHDTNVSKTDPFNDESFKTAFPENKACGEAGTLENFASFQDFDKIETLKPPQRSLTPVGLSRTSSLSSYHSSATNASLKRSDSLASSSRSDEGSGGKEDSTFEADFDQKNSFENPLSDKTSNFLSSPSSIPPPLPPRRSKPINEPYQYPPSILPPPLPSRINPNSDDHQSSSDSEDDHYSCPPNFEPPQLPSSTPLKTNLPDDFEAPFNFEADSSKNNVSFSSNNFVSSARKEKPTKFFLEENDAFNLPLKPPGAQPPKIPKRNFSTSSSELSNHANNATNQVTLAPPHAKHCMKVLIFFCFLLDFIFF